MKVTQVVASIHLYQHTESDSVNVSMVDVEIFLGFFAY